MAVYVKRTYVDFEISVYGKPTFTGQYLRWESFCPLKHKISPISTLVHQALMTCTESRLNGEIEQIKKILLDNGYPKNVINAKITKKITQFFTLMQFVSEKCPVYLKVSWIGKPSTNLEKKVKVSTCLVFMSKRMLPLVHEDVLPTTHKGFVIYEYKCCYDSQYMGQTSQWLQDCIKQHVPQWPRQQLTHPCQSQPH